MMATNFSAQIEAFVRKCEKRTTGVFRESAERVIEVMQTPRAAGGRMRIRTGFLRSSLMASTAAMPSIRPNAKPVDGQSYAYDGSAVSLVIAGADIGDTLYAGYTANYAYLREVGARGQAPDAFVRTAAQQWQGIVGDVVAEVRARVK